jgi:hypothetical protein
MLDERRTIPGRSERGGRRRKLTDTAALPTGGVLVDDLLYEVAWTRDAVE